MVPNLYPLKGLQGRVEREISAKPVTNFTINPMLIKSSLASDTYSLYFNNMCFSSEPRRGDLKVDQVELRKKLNTWLKPTDRGYVKLVDFNTTNSKFDFDVDKWLDDSLKNYKPYDNYMTMSRSYRLSKQLPYLVRVFGLEMDYSKYIADRFKRYVKNKPEFKKDLFSVVEDVSKKHLHLDASSMFDYRYDRVSNSVIVSVKPAYVTSILAAASVMAKDESWKKKINFDKTVGMFLKFN